MHFEWVISYVVVFLHMFTMFLFSSHMEIDRPLSPCLFILICFFVVLNCATIWESLGAHVFWRVLILAFPGVNVRMWPVVPMRPCPLAL